MSTLYIITVNVTAVNSDCKQATVKHSANTTKEYINALHENLDKYLMLTYQRLRYANGNF